MNLTQAIENVFCACILVYLLFCKKKMLSKCEFFLLKIGVLNGFLSVLEVCLVNLELPYNYESSVQMS